MTPRLDLPKQGGIGTSRRPARSGPARLVLCLLMCMAAWSHAAGGSDPRLELGKPYLEGKFVRLQIAVSGLIGDEVVEALHSGLPATIVFEWRIWQRRDGWWDRPVSGGTTFYRVFYDVLQNRFDVFDAHGRRLASSDNPRGIEQAVSEGPDLKLVGNEELSADGRYYAEMLARIKLLDEEEVKNLEDWLSGPDRQENGFNLVGMLSDRLTKVLDGIVGPGNRTVMGKTEDFSGF